VIDPASQHKLEIDEILDVGTTFQKRDLLPSIERVRAMMGGIPPGLTFAEGACDITIDQIRRYVWAQKRTSYTPGGGRDNRQWVNEPIKQYDHLLDAMRMGLCMLEDYGPPEGEPDPVGWVEQWKRNLKDRIHGELKRSMEPESDPWTV